MNNTNNVYDLLKDHANRLERIEEFVINENVDNATAMALYNKELSVYKEGVLSEIKKRIRANKASKVDLNPDKRKRKSLQETLFMITKYQSVNEFAAELNGLTSEINEYMSNKNPEVFVKLFTNNVKIVPMILRSNEATNYQFVRDTLKDLTMNDVQHTLYQPEDAVYTQWKKFDTASNSFMKTVEKFGEYAKKNPDAIKYYNRAESINARLQLLYDRMKQVIEKIREWNEWAEWWEDLPDNA